MADNADLKDLYRQIGERAQRRSRGELNQEEISESLLTKKAERAVDRVNNEKKAPP